MLPRPAQQRISLPVTHTYPSTPTSSSTSTIPDAMVAAAVSEASPGCPSAFCLLYHISERATWSDGTPVTAADFAYTVEVHVDPVSGTRAPAYVAISEADVLDDRTLRLVFDEPYGGWPMLFARVFRSGSEVGSIEGVDTTGPFVFEEWAVGEYLTLVRNGDWWADEDPLSGHPLGDVQRIRFVFVDSLAEMVDGLDDGEIDVISARPDPSAVEDMSEMEGVEYMVAPGPFWEHIDFHHEDPLLSQRWVREALSLAIDREKILDRTVRLVDPDAAALDNTIWMSNATSYEPHFEDRFDPRKAEQILVDNGCVKGEDGVYVCQRTRMSFTWATTDDPARREVFESAREDLEAVGVEIVGDFRSPSDFVTRDFLFGGPDAWQLVNFSWRARAVPIASNPTYYCDDAGYLNVNRYCSGDVEQLIRSTETMVRTESQAAAYNRADRLYLEDLALIPLYQKPTLMAWTADLKGPDPNYGLSGDLWNVAAWTGKQEIVVGLPSEPSRIEPLADDDDSANLILGSLLYGAFAMDPAHERVPVLVDSVEVIINDGR